jgi:ketosteroid isomerase-like protein
MTYHQRRTVAPRTAVASVILTVACAAAPERPAPADTAVVRAQIDTMWSRFTDALVAGDTAALARLYTDSVVFAETEAATARGRPALMAGAARAFASVRYLESRPRLEVTRVMGDRAFQFGTYRDVVQPAGQQPLGLHGRFAAVLERDSIARWRIGSLIVIRDSVVPMPKAPR